jgi:alpha-tubulin suppressor-like RCC1 family protein
LSIKAVTYHINQLILKTCAGNDFLLILTRNGHVYSMGTGSRGELGISPMEAHTDEPRPIQDLIDADIKVIDIACGGWHGLALTCKPYN